MLLPEPTASMRGQLCVPLFEHGHTDWVAWAGGSRSTCKLQSLEVWENAVAKLCVTVLFIEPTSEQRCREFVPGGPAFLSSCQYHNRAASAGRENEEEVSSESPMARPTRSTLKNLS